MRTLLIVWTSTTSGTEQMVQAAARGARADDVTVRLMHASKGTGDDVLTADALLFATPEHLGSMAGPMKTFFDLAYYTCLDRVIGKPWALMVCAGTDGTGTIRQIQRIATGWKLKAIAEPLLVVTNAHRPEDILAKKRIGEGDLKRCEDLGALLAAGLSAGLF